MYYEELLDLSILQPNIIVLGQCMTLKPCTDPDIRFSYFGTGMVTHKIAVEKAGDDRYFQNMASLLNSITQDRL